MDDLKKDLLECWEEIKYWVAYGDEWGEPPIVGRILILILILTSVSIFSLVILTFIVNVPGVGIIIALVITALVLFVNYCKKTTKKVER